MTSHTSRPKRFFLSRHTCSPWETPCSVISSPRCAGPPMEIGSPHALIMGTSHARSTNPAAFSGCNPPLKLRPQSADPPFDDDQPTPPLVHHTVFATCNS